MAINFGRTIRPASVVKAAAKRKAAQAVQAVAKPAEVPAAIPPVRDGNALAAALAKGPLIHPGKSGVAVAQESGELPGPRPSAQPQAPKSTPEPAQIPRKATISANSALEDLRALTVRRAASTLVSVRLDTELMAAFSAYCQRNDIPWRKALKVLAERAIVSHLKA